MQRFLTILAAFLALGLSAAAQAQTYKIDHAHSYLGFEIDHLGFSTTKGQFHDYDVTVVANWEDIERSGVIVTIKTTSVDTAWDPRDEHLRKSDFFNVEEFPVMKFVGKNVEKTGENRAKVSGELTLRGTTKPVTLDVELVKRALYPFGDKKEALGIKASGVLKRSDWGMSYAIPAVSDEVKIIIDGELKIAE